MDHKRIAEEIINIVGGRKNIVSVSYCASRVTLILWNNDRYSHESAEKSDFIKGVFFSSGQLNIILGNDTAHSVYDELAAMGIKPAEVRAHRKSAGGLSKIRRFAETAADISSPFIPLMSTAGIFLGIAEGLAAVCPGMGDSKISQLIHLICLVPYIAFPILLCISGAELFGTAKYMGAIVGVITVILSYKILPDNFGYKDVRLNIIQGIIGVWLISRIDKKLKLPGAVHMLAASFLELLAAGIALICITEPLFRFIEAEMMRITEYIIRLPLGTSSFIVGAVYTPLSLMGFRHIFCISEANMLSSTGLNTLMPVISAADIAQGAAALGFAVKTNSTFYSFRAFPASVSAFLGVQEPAVLGVNIRLPFVFASGIIGGAVGGFVSSVLGVEALDCSAAGIFGVFLTSDYYFQYIIAMTAAFITAFTLSWLFADNR